MVLWQRPKPDHAGATYMVVKTGLDQTERLKGQFLYLLMSLSFDVETDASDIVNAAALT